MVKPVILTASFAVALALAAPSIAQGQAIPKTSGGSSSSTTTTGSAKPSSGGGDGGSVVSGGGGSGVSQPPSAPPPSSSSSSSGSDLSGFSRSIKGGSVTSSAKGENVQKAPAPGGIAAVVKGEANPSASSSLSTTRLGLRGVTDSGSVGSGGAGGRGRGDYPLQGFATPRTDAHGDFISFPFYGPWGSWYPWYAGGFGWYAGYYGYNPWDYPATCWSWNFWGPWFDPNSYCWDPYSGGSYPMYDPGSNDEHGSQPAATTGTLRIKANVATAKVYIDKAFAGTVEEFNGLGNHLEIDGGRHVVELRADGYKTISKEIEVKIGKTQTARFSLKKN